MAKKDIELDYAQLLETNYLMQKWGEEAYYFLVTRTVQESKLFPVSSYILFSYLNCFYRWPTLLRKIEQHMTAEEIGDRVRNMGGKPRGAGNWALPGFYLLGREWMINLGLLRPQDAVEDTAYVMDFWKRFKLSLRRNQHALMAVDAGRRAQVLPEQKVQVFHADMYECEEGDPLFEAAQSFLASMTQYSFLGGCESRANMDNHGPYFLDDERKMLVREFCDLAECALPWMDEVAKDMPFNNLTFTQVLKGVDINEVDETGSFDTQPELQPQNTVGVGLYASDFLSDGYIPVGMASREELIDTLTDLASKANQAAAELWKRMALYSRDQLMDAGALCYYAMIKDFALIAGCYDPEEWMKIDERAERYRPLLNDQYGNEVIGGLCVFTLPSHITSEYRAMQHSNLAQQPFTPFPLSVLKDNDGVPTVGDTIAPGITYLDPKVDRFRTTRGVLTIDELNKQMREFVPEQCSEDNRFLCETWVKYNAGSEAANALYRSEQSQSRNLKDRGAGLRREDIEALRK